MADREEGTMPEGMLERIARAICVEARISPEHWRIYQGWARAAVEAMLEPTPEMIVAGWAMVDLHLCDGMDGALLALWQNMLIAALETKEA